MGNYGNTLDRWYRRAAVVVWPRERAFAARAEAGSQWALSQLHTRSRGRRSGRGTCRRRVARAVLENRSDRRRDCWVPRCRWRQTWALPGRQRCCWSRSGWRRSRRSTLAGSRRRPGSTARQWTRGVIDGWFGPGRHFEPDRYQWVERLPGLCAALRAAGAPEVARLLAAGAWSWMGDQLRLWTATARAGMREPQLEMLSSPLMRLLEAADDELRDEIVAALRGYGDNVLGCLMPALRSAAALPAAARRAAGLDVVARDCAQRLGAIIARPLRGEDDWSIGWTGCGCDLCGTLGTFLGFPVATDLRVAAGDRRAAARAHPDRLGRAAGAAPDPAAGTAVHARADEDRRTVRTREGREATGRVRPGVADVGMG